MLGADHESRITVYSKQDLSGLRGNICLLPRLPCSAFKFLLVVHSCVERFALKDLYVAVTGQFFLHLALQSYGQGCN